MDKAKMEAARRNYNFQKVIAVVGFILMSGKFLAYYITGSVAILTDAMESIVNVVAGVIGLYALYLTMKPADDSHPYGHGKIELISSSIEGSMISIAGALIILESVDRFLHPSDINSLDIGLVIVAVAALVNFVMGYTAIRMGRSTNSVALEASGKHLCSDTYSSVGILLGLGIVYAGNALGYDLGIFDPIMALIFGAVIVVTGVRVLLKSMNGIMDSADIEVLRVVTRCINHERDENVIDVHHLRVVRYGSSVHVDAHMTVPGRLTVEEVEKIVDRFSKAIKDQLGDDVDITFMAESCDNMFCRYCQDEGCDHRAVGFVDIKYLGIDTVIKNDTHYLKAVRGRNERISDTKDEGKNGE